MSQQQDSLFSRFQQAMDSPPLSHDKQPHHDSSRGQEEEEDNLDLDLDKITAEILAHHHLGGEQSDDGAPRVGAEGAPPTDSVGPSLVNSAEEEETKDFKSFPAPLVHTSGVNHANYNQAHSSLAQRSALDKKPLGVIPTHIPKVVNFPAKTSGGGSSRSLLRKDSSSNKPQQQYRQKKGLGESAPLSQSTGSNKSTAGDQGGQGTQVGKVPSFLGLSQKSNNKTEGNPTIGGSDLNVSTNSTSSPPQQRSVRYRHPVDPVAQAKAQKEVQEQLQQQQQQQPHHQLSQQQSPQMPPAQQQYLNMPAQPPPMMVSHQQGTAPPPPMMMMQPMMVPPGQQQHPMMMIPMVPMMPPPSNGRNTGGSGDAPQLPAAVQGYYVALPNGQMAFQPAVMPMQ